MSFRREATPLSNVPLCHHDHWALDGPWLTQSHTCPWLQQLFLDGVTYCLPHPPPVLIRQNTICLQQ